MTRFHNPFNISTIRKQSWKMPLNSVRKRLFRHAEEALRAYGKARMGTWHCLFRYTACLPYKAGQYEKALRESIYKEIKKNFAGEHLNPDNIRISHNTHKTVPGRSSRFCFPENQCKDFLLSILNKYPFRMNGDACADYTREAIVIFKSWMIIMKNRITFHVRWRAYSGSGIHAKDVCLRLHASLWEPGVTQTRIEYRLAAI